MLRSKFSRATSARQSQSRQWQCVRVCVPNWREKNITKFTKYSPKYGLHFECINWCFATNPLSCLHFFTHLWFCARGICMNTRSIQNDKVFKMYQDVANLILGREVVCSTFLRETRRLDPSRLALDHNWRDPVFAQGQTRYCNAR